jgi:hypothetical protein
MVAEALCVDELLTEVEAEAVHVKVPVWVMLALMTSSKPAVVV